MKLNEFKRIVKDSGQFNIDNRVNKIDVSSFISDSYYEKKKPFPRKMVFSALSLIIILTMGLFVRLSVNPVTTLTIDINPSIELELNVFKRVVNISGTNQEGLEFIEEIDYKNKPIDDVIISIYNKGVDMAYFSESEAYMLIGIYGEDYDSEVSLSAILGEISEVTILSIFQHNQSDQQYSLYLSSESAESDDYIDSTVGDNQTTVNGDPTYVYSEIYDGFEDISVLANDYGISKTKMLLVIDVFNGYSEYTTESNLIYLTELDIATLIELYNDLD